MTDFQRMILRAIFHGEPLSIGDSLWMSWHTDDPCHGDQATHEATYKGYRRIPRSRDKGNWAFDPTAGFSPAYALEAPMAVDGDEKLTHIGIGTSASGAGMLLFSAALPKPIKIEVGIQPVLQSGTVIGCAKE